MRRTRGTSILGWQVAVFAIAVNPAVYFLDFFLGNAFSPMTPYSDIEIRIFRAILLSNCIAIGYLAVLLGVLQRRNRITPKETGACATRPAVFWLLSAFALTGILLELTTSQFQLVLHEGIATIGNYEEYYKVRGEVSTMTPDLLHQHIFAMSVVVCLPLVVLFSFQQFLLWRTRRWLWRWIVLAILWSLNSVLIYQKSPIVVVIVGHLAVLLLTLVSRPIKLRQLLMYGFAATIVAFGLVHGVYVVLGASSSLSESFLLLCDRIWGIPMYTTYYHFYIFPDFSEHTRYSMSTTMNLLLGGGKRVDTGGLLPYEVASSIIVGTAFDMNSGFLGSCWAELGYVGVMEGALIIFGVCFLWDVYFLRHRGVSARALLCAFFVGYSFNIVNISLLAMLLPGGLILAPIYTLFLFRSAAGPARFELRKQKLLPANAQLLDRKQGA
jgi:hypothetical protein